MDYQFIPIQKNLIPYQFDIRLDGKTFTFVIRYNAQGNFFNTDLSRNGELIVAGEKIVYGRTLFVNQQHLDVPTTPIIPYDLAMNEDKVSWDNLGETVFLWIPTALDENSEFGRS
ncbi:MAG: hypothetical protein FWD01_03145 [Defluviitaleaceae bacterium]|nr:hypothetical protein [Defluviitaleaceae bacterium]